MRIALISEHASPLAALGGVDAGGQNTHVAELSTALADGGHDVTVYTRRDDERLAECVPVRAGVNVVHVPAGPPRYVPKDDLLPYMGQFGAWLAARWAGSAGSPDVVHAHFWMSGLAALTAAGRTGVPVTLTYHALGSVKRRHQGARDTSPAMRVGYERMLGKRVDRVVAQCQDEVDELTSLGVPRARIAVIPSGVDSARFTPDGAAAPRDPDRRRVLTVGRLVPRKGFQDIIRSLRWVPGTECVIVGGPPGRAAVEDQFGRRLMAIAEGAGVADRVRLVGAVPREEMPAWYRSADLFVTTPWYEPFGLTPLEAMACGVPVVATGVGGLRDTVVHGITGELVPPRDPERLGRVMRRLLNEPTRRFEFATAALDRARTCYSWERTAEQLTAVYRAVAGRTTGAVA
jgi:glycosyltransferase involved in cell wall biosynthesis